MWTLALWIIGSVVLLFLGLCVMGVLAGLIFGAQDDDQMNYQVQLHEARDSAERQAARLKGLVAISESARTRNGKDAA